jgi:PPK2 family polyphosphate:nucleotide phosphotransferase
MEENMNIKDCCFDGTKKFDFKKFNTKGDCKNADKEKFLKKSEKNLLGLKEWQDKFYASGNEAMLIIFQAMDAGGKDGAIKHVMTGMNPQGIDVTNFKQPSSEEMSHDYLWRAVKALPRRGKIGIFNRSYYEDVLVAKIHNLYMHQNLPARSKSKDTILQRYQQISNFEKYLWENGTRIIKFFLCISKGEQKRRFLSRIEDTSKNWKFSESDLKERNYWDDYMEAYQDAINATGQEYAPWYVIPSDRKWFARFLISEAVTKLFANINPKYPEFPDEKRDKLFVYKEFLVSEDLKK